MEFRESNTMRELTNEELGAVSGGIGPINIGVGLGAVGTLVDSVVGLLNGLVGSVGTLLTGLLNGLGTTLGGL